MVVRVPSLTRAGDSDRGQVFENAFSLADTATCTEIGIYLGLLQNTSASVSELHFLFDEIDGLFGNWAVLLTDDALPLIGVRKTAVRVDRRETDLDLLPFFDSQRIDRPGGADLSAQVALVFAVPDLRNELGGPKTIQTGVCHSRVQPVRWADLHAKATGDAALEELTFGQSPGRTNQ